MLTIDPKLKQWATEAQSRYIDAINEKGSYRGAAKFLGCRHQVLMRGVASVKRKAALQGYSPEHDMRQIVPAPYILKGTSTLYDADGIPKLQWVKTKLDQEMMAESIKMAVESLMDDARGLIKPSKAPKHTHKDLCNLFTLTDCHVGMLAWGKETGNDWNLKIAENTLCDAFSHLVESAPKADVAVVLQLGDFLHFDGLKAITPEHGNLLDADGRYSKVVVTSIRILRTVIDTALTRHKKVHVVMAEGNHDQSSAVWLRHLFSMLYENEPRVTVNDSETPYYIYQHGNTLLGFHHGHLKKTQSLPGLFAASYRKQWGASSKVYIHTGHRHHVEEREHDGAKIIQHATIAARDSYAARYGFVSEREMSSITYHAAFGQVARNTVTPEMLQEGKQ
jgi:hypothetical protein